MAIYLGDLELATGGGSTGTGLPVNTYESFSVAATGNPTGYNATTGLYTHPNGDYWLKTGNTVSDIASAYPNATGVISWGSTSFIASTATWQAPMLNSFPAIAPTTIPIAQVGGFLWAGPNAAGGVGGNGALQKYTTAGVFISKIEGGGQTLGDTFTDGHTANIFSFDNSGQTVREYNISGLTLTPVNTYTLTGVTQANFLTYDPTLGKYFTIDTSNNFIRYNTSFVEEKRITITTPSSGLPWYGGYVSGNQIICNRNSTMYSFPTNMTNTVSTSAATGTGSTIRDIALFNPTGTQNELLFTNQNSFIKQTSNFVFGNVVGDSTARTDTDSAQPLFIKLK